ncbi:hypothetical protein ACZ91_48115 [Streptomyces regensis]|nr:hypothetical protein ACZ91_48115 [Streptomyces regensis]
MRQVGGTAFSVALRSAIATSGLGLDRIQARLQDHGIAISVTALSYWQSGKRQPERQSSMATSRRRHDEGDRAPLSLDRQPDVSLVGLHDHCTVTSNGTADHSIVTAKAVFRAQADGQDRWLLAYRQDGMGDAAATPALSAVRNCAVGRVEEDPQAGLTLAELVFSRPIDTGETHLIEYSLEYRHQPDSDSRKAHFREFWKPIPEYLLEVDFEPGRFPEQCWRYSHRSNGGAAESHDLTIDELGRAHAIATNFGPGVFGIGWM